MSKNNVVSLDDYREEEDNSEMSELGMLLMQSLNRDRIIVYPPFLKLCKRMTTAMLLTHLVNLWRANDDSSFSISVSNLCDDLGVLDKALKRARTNLLNMGFISMVIKPGKTNYYFVNVEAIGLQLEKLGILEE